MPQVSVPGKGALRETMFHRCQDERELVVAIREQVGGQRQGTPAIHTSHSALRLVDT